MYKDSRAMTAIIGGAVLGGLAGYFFFTERGRSLRRNLEPALEQFARELNGFRSTLQRAVGVATEGWNMLNEGGGPGTAGSGVH
jgi:hypothetical protein